MRRPEEGSRSPEASIAGGYELPMVDAGKLMGSL